MVDSLQILSQNRPNDFISIQSYQDFVKFLKDERKKVLLFYWKECGPCKAFIPEYVRFIEDQKSSDILFAAVESQNDRFIQSYFGLTPDYYPKPVLIDEKNKLKHTFRYTLPIEKFKDELKEQTGLTFSSKRTGGGKKKEKVHSFVKSSNCKLDFCKIHGSKRVFKL